MATQLNNSVARAFAILEMFTERRSQVTAGDVARELGLNAVTAHRFLRSLESVGAIVAETRGTYRLTDHGRRTFLTKLESRFDETITHPTFNYKATYRRSLELQTRLLAKTIMGEIPTYPPFITR